jgi:predicted RNA binding protein YcfA (HicA-like mRNA interferase family)
MPMKPRKILEKLLGGSLNISFNDFRKLIEAFGFRLSRMRGSHHIFVHPSVPELVNVRNVGGQAKPYQVRQFLKLVEEYNLSLEDDS